MAIIMIYSNKSLNNNFKDKNNNTFWHHRQYYLLVYLTPDHKLGVRQEADHFPGVVFLGMKKSFSNKQYYLCFRKRQKDLSVV